MARRLNQHGPRSPSKRWRSHSDGLQEAVFFPNEVAELFGMTDVDYAQLRFFWKLIRQPWDPYDAAGTLGRGWSRFSFLDMACLLEAVLVCGGREAFAPGRRMTRRGLATACRALHAQGFDVPLLQVRIRRIGRDFLVASDDGMLCNPVTGQAAIEGVADVSDTRFGGHLLSDPELQRSLEHEIDRHRRAWSKRSSGP